MYNMYIITYACVSTRFTQFQQCEHHSMFLLELQPWQRRWAEHKQPSLLWTICSYTAVFKDVSFSDTKRMNPQESRICYWILIMCTTSLRHPSKPTEMPEEKLFYFDTQSHHRGDGFCSVVVAYSVCVYLIIISCKGTLVLLFWLLLITILLPISDHQIHTRESGMRWVLRWKLLLALFQLFSKTSHYLTRHYNANESWQW